MTAGVDRQRAGLDGSTGHLRSGVLGIALLAVVSLVAGCSGPIDSSAASGGLVAGPSGGSGVGPSGGASAPTASPRPLTGIRLPAGIEPGGLDADRFVFADRQGVVVLGLGTGNTMRLPAPPRGLAFRPTAISGNLVVGEVTGAEGADPRAVEAMGYDFAAQSWVDIAAALPAGHASTAIATDGVTVVGMDLGAPGSKGAAVAYAFTVATGTLADLPSLPDGTVPTPTAVGDGHVVGFVGSADKGGGWVLDQSTGAYTTLASAAGSNRASALGVAGDLVVGVLNGTTPSGDSPFVYDLATRTFTDLHLTGYRARDVSGRQVLLAADDGWDGRLLNLDSGAETPFSGVAVEGTPVGVRPWEMSDGWVVGMTAPASGSTGAFGGLVAITIGRLR